MTSLKDCTCHIGFDLERQLFPEIFYGHKMVDRKSNILQHGSPVESSLNCDKINLLVRFAGGYIQNNIFTGTLLILACL
jgi:hypothetical protein